MLKRPRIGSLVKIPPSPGYNDEEQFGIVLEVYGYPSYWDYWILIGDEREVYCVNEFEEYHEE